MQPLPPNNQPQVTGLPAYDDYTKRLLTGEEALTPDKYGIIDTATNKTIAEIYQSLQDDKELNPNGDVKPLPELYKAATEKEAAKAAETARIEANKANPKDIPFYQQDPIVTKQEGNKPSFPSREEVIKNAPDDKKLEVSDQYDFAAAQFKKSLQESYQYKTRPAFSFDFSERPQDKGAASNTLGGKANQDLQAMYDSGKVVVIGDQKFLKGDDNLYTPMGVVNEVVVPREFYKEKSKEGDRYLMDMDATRRAKYNEVLKGAYFNQKKSTPSNMTSEQVASSRGLYIKKQKPKYDAQGNIIPISKEQMYGSLADYDLIEDNASGWFGNGRTISRINEEGEFVTLAYDKDPVTGEDVLVEVDGNKAIANERLRSAYGAQEKKNTGQIGDSFYNSVMAIMGSVGNASNAIGTSVKQAGDFDFGVSSWKDFIDYGWKNFSIMSIVNGPVAMLSSGLGTAGVDTRSIGGAMQKWGEQWTNDFNASKVKISEANEAEGVFGSWSAAGRTVADLVPQLGASFGAGAAASISARVAARYGAVLAAKGISAVGRGTAVSVGFMQGAAALDNEAVSMGVNAEDRKYLWLAGGAAVVMSEALLGNAGGLLDDYFKTTSMSVRSQAMSKAVAAALNEGLPGLQAAATSAAKEQAAKGIWSKALYKFREYMDKAVSGTGVTGWAGRTIGTAFEEGSEEAVENIINNFAKLSNDYFLADEKATIGKGKFGMSASEVLDGTMENFFAGMLGGALMGGVFTRAPFKDVNKAYEAANVVADAKSFKDVQAFADMVWADLKFGNPTIDENGHFISPTEVLEGKKKSLNDLGKEAFLAELKAMWAIKEKLGFSNAESIQRVFGSSNATKLLTQTIAAVGIQNQLKKQLQEKTALLAETQDPAMRQSLEAEIKELQAKTVKSDEEIAYVLSGEALRHYQLSKQLTAYDMATQKDAKDEDTQAKYSSQGDRLFDQNKRVRETMSMIDEAMAKQEKSELQQEFDKAIKENRTRIENATAAKIKEKEAAAIKSKPTDAEGKAAVLTEAEKADIKSKAEQEAYAENAPMLQEQLAKLKQKSAQGLDIADSVYDDMKSLIDSTRDAVAARVQAGASASTLELDKSFNRSSFMEAGVFNLQEVNEAGESVGDGEQYFAANASGAIKNGEPDLNSNFGFLSSSMFDKTDFVDVDLQDAKSTSEEGEEYYELPNGYEFDSKELEQAEAKIANGEKPFIKAYKKNRVYIKDGKRYKLKKQSEKSYDSVSNNLLRILEELDRQLQNAQTALAAIKENPADAIAVQREVELIKQKVSKVEDNLITLSKLNMLRKGGYELSNNKAKRQAYEKWLDSFFADQNFMLIDNYRAQINAVITDIDAVIAQNAGTRNANFIEIEQSFVADQKQAVEITAKHLGIDIPKDIADAMTAATSYIEMLGVISKFSKSLSVEQRDSLIDMVKAANSIGSDQSNVSRDGADPVNKNDVLRGNASAEYLATYNFERFAYHILAMASTIDGESGYGKIVSTMAAAIQNKAYEYAHTVEQLNMSFNAIVSYFANSMLGEKRSGNVPMFNGAAGSGKTSYVMPLVAYTLNKLTGKKIVVAAPYEVQAKGAKTAIEKYTGITVELANGNGSIGNGELKDYDANNSILLVDEYTLIPSFENAVKLLQSTGNFFIAFGDTKQVSAHAFYAVDGKSLVPVGNPLTYSGFGLSLNEKAVPSLGLTQIMRSQYVDIGTIQYKLREYTTNKGRNSLGSIMPVDFGAGAWAKKAEGGYEGVRAMATADSVIQSFLDRVTADTDAPAMLIVLNEEAREAVLSKIADTKLREAIKEKVRVIGVSESGYAAQGLTVEEAYIGFSALEFNKLHPGTAIRTYAAIELTAMSRAKSFLAYPITGKNMDASSITEATESRLIPKQPFDKEATDKERVSILDKVKKLSTSKAGSTAAVKAEAKPKATAIKAEVKPKAEQAKNQNTAKEPVAETEPTEPETEPIVNPDEALFETPAPAQPTAKEAEVETTKQEMENKMAEALALKEEMPAENAEQITDETEEEIKAEPIPAVSTEDISATEAVESIETDLVIEPLNEEVVIAQSSDMLHIPTWNAPAGTSVAEMQATLQNARKNQASLYMHYVEGVTVIGADGKEYTNNLVIVSTEPQKPAVINGEIEKARSVVAAFNYTGNSADARNSYFADFVNSGKSANVSLQGFQTLYFKPEDAASPNEDYNLSGKNILDAVDAAYPGYKLVDLNIENLPIFTKSVNGVTMFFAEVTIAKGKTKIKLHYPVKPATYDKETQQEEANNAFWYKRWLSKDEAKFAFNSSNQDNESEKVMASINKNPVFEFFNANPELLKLQVENGKLKMADYVITILDLTEQDLDFIQSFFVVLEDGKPRLVLNEQSYKELKEQGKLDEENVGKVLAAIAFNGIKYNEDYYAEGINNPNNIAVYQPIASYVSATPTKLNGYKYFRRWAAFGAKPTSGTITVKKEGFIFYSINNEASLEQQEFVAVGEAMSELQDIAGDLSVKITGERFTDKGEVIYGSVQANGLMQLTNFREKGIAIKSLYHEAMHFLLEFKATEETRAKVYAEVLAKTGLKGVQASEYLSVRAEQYASERRALTGVSKYLRKFLDFFTRYVVDVFPFVKSEARRFMYDSFVARKYAKAPMQRATMLPFEDGTNELFSAKDELSTTYGGDVNGSYRYGAIMSTGKLLAEQFLAPSLSKIRVANSTSKAGMAFRDAYNIVEAQERVFIEDYMQQKGLLIKNGDTLTIQGVDYKRDKLDAAARVELRKALLAEASKIKVEVAGKTYFLKNLSKDVKAFQAFMSMDYEPNRKGAELFRSYAMLNDANLQAVFSQYFPGISLKDVKANTVTGAIIANLAIRDSINDRGTEETDILDKQSAIIKMMLSLVPTKKDSYTNSVSGIDDYRTISAFVTSIVQKGRLQYPNEPVYKVLEEMLLRATMDNTLPNEQKEAAKSLYEGVFNSAWRRSNGPLTFAGLKRFADEVASLSSYEAKVELAKSLLESQKAYLESQGRINLNMATAEDLLASLKSMEATATEFLNAVSFFYGSTSVDSYIRTGLDGETRLIADAGTEEMKQSMLDNMTYTLIDEKGKASKGSIAVFGLNGKPLSFKSAGGGNKKAEFDFSVNQDKSITLRYTYGIQGKENTIDVAVIKNGQVEANNSFSSSNNDEAAQTFVKDVFDFLGIPLSVKTAGILSSKSSSANWDRKAFAEWSAVMLLAANAQTRQLYYGITETRNEKNEYSYKSSAANAEEVISSSVPFFEALQLIYLKAKDNKAVGAVKKDVSSLLNRNSSQGEEVATAGDEVDNEIYSPMGMYKHIERLANLLARTQGDGAKPFVLSPQDTKVFRETPNDTIADKYTNGSSAGMKDKLMLNVESTALQALIDGNDAPFESWSNANTSSPVVDEKNGYEIGYKTHNPLMGEETIVTEVAYTMGLYGKPGKRKPLKAMLKAENFHLSSKMLNDSKKEPLGVLIQLHNQSNRGRQRVLRVKLPTRTKDSVNGVFLKNGDVDYDAFANAAAARFAIAQQAQLASLKRWAVSIMRFNEDSKFGVFNPEIVAVMQDYIARIDAVKIGKAEYDHKGFIALVNEISNDIQSRIQKSDIYTSDEFLSRYELISTKDYMVVKQGQSTTFRLGLATTMDARIYANNGDKNTYADSPNDIFNAYFFNMEIEVENGDGKKVKTTIGEVMAARHVGFSYADYKKLVGDTDKNLMRNAEDVLNILFKKRFKHNDSAMKQARAYNYHFDQAQKKKPKKERTRMIGMSKGGDYQPENKVEEMLHTLINDFDKEAYYGGVHSYTSYFVELQDGKATKLDYHNTANKRSGSYTTSGFKPEWNGDINTNTGVFNYSIIAAQERKETVSRVVRDENGSDKIETEEFGLEPYDGQSHYNPFAHVIFQYLSGASFTNMSFEKPIDVTMDATNGLASIFKLQAKFLTMGNQSPMEFYIAQQMNNPLNRAVSLDFNASKAFGNTNEAIYDAQGNPILSRISPQHFFMIAYDDSRYDELYAVVSGIAQSEEFRNALSSANTIKGLDISEALKQEIERRYFKGATKYNFDQMNSRVKYELVKAYAKVFSATTNPDLKKGIDRVMPTAEQEAVLISPQGRLEEAYIRAFYEFLLPIHKQHSAYAKEAQELIARNEKPSDELIANLRSTRDALMMRVADFKESEQKSESRSKKRRFTYGSEYKAKMGKGKKSNKQLSDKIQDEGLVSEDGKPAMQDTGNNVRYQLRDMRVIGNMNTDVDDSDSSPVVQLMNIIVANPENYAGDDNQGLEILQEIATLTELGLKDFKMKIIQQGVSEPAKIMLDKSINGIQDVLQQLKAIDAKFFAKKNASNSKDMRAYKKAKEDFTAVLKEMVKNSSGNSSDESILKELLNNDNVGLDGSGLQVLIYRYMSSYIRKKSIKAKYAGMRLIQASGDDLPIFDVKLKEGVVVPMMLPDFIKHLVRTGMLPVNYNNALVSNVLYAVFRDTASGGALSANAQNLIKAHAPSLLDYLMQKDNQPRRLKKFTANADGVTMQKAEMVVPATIYSRFNIPANTSIVDMFYLYTKDDVVDLVSLSKDKKALANALSMYIAATGSNALYVNGKPNAKHPFYGNAYLRSVFFNSYIQGLYESMAAGDAEAQSKFNSLVKGERGSNDFLTQAANAIAAVRTTTEAALGVRIPSGPGSGYLGTIIGFTGESATRIYANSAHMYFDGSDNDIDQTSVYYEGVEVGDNDIQTQSGNKIFRALRKHYEDAKKSKVFMVATTTDDIKAVAKKAQEDNFNGAHNLAASINSRDAAHKGGVVGPMALAQKLFTELFAAFSNIAKGSTDSKETLYARLFGGQYDRRYSDEGIIKLMADIEQMVNGATDNPKLMALGPLGIALYNADVVTAMAMTLADNNDKLSQGEVNMLSHLLKEEVRNSIAENLGITNGLSENDIRQAPFYYFLAFMVQSKAWKYTLEQVEYSQRVDTNVFSRKIVSVAFDSLSNLGAGKSDAQSEINDLDKDRSQLLAIMQEKVSELAKLGINTKKAFNIGRVALTLDTISEMANTEDGLKLNKTAVKSISKKLSEAINEKATALKSKLSSVQGALSLLEENVELEEETNPEDVQDLVAEKDLEQKDQDAESMLSKLKSLVSNTNLSKEQKQSLAAELETLYNLYKKKNSVMYYLNRLKGVEARKQKLQGRYSDAFVSDMIQVLQHAILGEFNTRYVKIVNINQGTKSDPYDEYQYLENLAYVTGMSYEQLMSLYREFKNSDYYNANDILGFLDSKRQRADYKGANTFIYSINGEQVNTTENSERMYANRQAQSDLAWQTEEIEVVDPLTGKMQVISYRNAFFANDSIALMFADPALMERLKTIEVLQATEEFSASSNMPVFKSMRGKLMKLAGLDTLNEGQYYNLQSIVDMYLVNRWFKSSVKVQRWLNAIRDYQSKNILPENPLANFSFSFKNNGDIASYVQFFPDYVERVIRPAFAAAAARNEEWAVNPTVQLFFSKLTSRVSGNRKFVGLSSAVGIKEEEDARLRTALNIMPDWVKYAFTMYHLAKDNLNYKSSTFGRLLGVEIYEDYTKFAKNIYGSADEIMNSIGEDGINLIMQAITNDPTSFLQRARRSFVNSDKGAIVTIEPLLDANGGLVQFLYSQSYQKYSEKFGFSSVNLATEVKQDENVLIVKNSNQSSANNIDELIDFNKLPISDTGLTINAALQFGTKLKLSETDEVDIRGRQTLEAFTEEKRNAMKRKDAATRDVKVDAMLGIQKDWLLSDISGNVQDIKASLNLQFAPMVLGDFTEAIKDPNVSVAKFLLILQTAYRKKKKNENHTSAVDDKIAEIDMSDFYANVIAIQEIEQHLLAKNQEAEIKNAEQQQYIKTGDLSYDLIKAIGVEPAFAVPTVIDFEQDASDYFQKFSTSEFNELATRAWKKKIGGRYLNQNDEYSITVGGTLLTGSAALSAIGQRIDAEAVIMLTKWLRGIMLLKPEARPANYEEVISYFLENKRSISSSNTYRNSAAQTFATMVNMYKNETPVANRSEANLKEWVNKTLTYLAEALKKNDPVSVAGLALSYQVYAPSANKVAPYEDNAMVYPTGYTGTNLDQLKLGTESSAYTARENIYALLSEPTGYGKTIDFAKANSFMSEISSFISNRLDTQNKFSVHQYSDEQQQQIVADFEALIDSLLEVNKKAAIKKHLGLTGNDYKTKFENIYNMFYKEGYKAALSSSAEMHQEHASVLAADQAQDITLYMDFLSGQIFKHGDLVRFDDGNVGRVVSEENYEKRKTGDERLIDTWKPRRIGYKLIPKLSNRAVIISDKMYALNQEGLSKAEKQAGMQAANTMSNIVNGMASVLKSLGIETVVEDSLDKHSRVEVDVNGNAIVYLSKNADYATQIHEYGHIVINVLKNTGKGEDMIKRLAQLLKGTSVKTIVLATQPDLTEDVLSEEMVAHFLQLITYDKMKLMSNNANEPEAARLYDAMLVEFNDIFSAGGSQELKELGDKLYETVTSVTQYESFVENLKQYDFDMNQENLIAAMKTTQAYTLYSKLDAKMPPINLGNLSTLFLGSSNRSSANEFAETKLNELIAAGEVHYLGNLIVHLNPNHPSNANEVGKKNLALAYKEVKAKEAELYVSMNSKMTEKLAELSLKKEYKETKNTDRRGQMLYELFAEPLGFKLKSKKQKELFADDYQTSINGVRGMIEKIGFEPEKDNVMTLSAYMQQKGVSVANAKASLGDTDLTVIVHDAGTANERISIVEFTKQDIARNNGKSLGASIGVKSNTRLRESKQSVSAVKGMAAVMLMQKASGKPVRLEKISTVQIQYKDYHHVHSVEASELLSFINDMRASLPNDIAAAIDPVLAEALLFDANTIQEANYDIPLLQKIKNLANGIKNTWDMEASAEKLIATVSKVEETGAIEELIKLEKLLFSYILYIKDVKCQGEEKRFYANAEALQVMQMYFGVTDRNRANPLAMAQHTKDVIDRWTATVDRYDGAIENYVADWVNVGSRSAVAKLEPIVRQNFQLVDAIHKSSTAKLGIILDSSEQLFEPLFKTVKAYNSKGELVDVKTFDIYTCAFDENGQPVARDPKNAEEVKEVEQIKALMAQGKLTRQMLSYANFVDQQMQEELVQYIMQRDSNLAYSKDAEKIREAAVARAANIRRRGQLPVMQGRYTEALRRGDLKEAASKFFSQGVFDNSPFENYYQDREEVNGFYKVSSQFWSQFTAAHINLTDTRLDLLGLAYNDKGELIIVDEEKNRGLSGNIENIFNYTMAASIRARSFNPVLSKLNASMMLLNMLQQQRGVDAKQAIEDMQMYINRQVYGDLPELGKLNVMGTIVNLDNMLGATGQLIHMMFLSLSPISAVKNAMAGAIKGTANGLVNSIAEKMGGELGLFGLSNIQKAVSLLTENPALVAAINSKYQVVAMGERDIISHAKHVRTKRNLSDKDTSMIGQFFGEYYNGLIGMLAQMDKEGTLDAHSLNDKGELVYDVKKDTRFYDETGKEHLDAYLLIADIRDAQKREGYHQVPATGISAAYSAGDETRLKIVVQRFIGDMMDGQFKNKMSAYAFPRAMMSLRNYLFNLRQYWWSATKENPLLGKRQFKEVDGKKQVVWDAPVAEGVMQTMWQVMKLVYKHKGQTAAELAKLSDYQKRNLASMLVFGILSAIGALLVHFLMNDDEEEQNTAQMLLARTFFGAMNEQLGYINPAMLYEEAVKKPNIYVQQMDNLYNMLISTVCLAPYVGKDDGDFITWLRAVSKNLPYAAGARSIGDIIQSISEDLNDKK